MALTLNFIIALSLLSIVNATQLTLKKDGYKVYIETDSQHYAIFKPIDDEYGDIVVVDGNIRYSTYKKCDINKVELDKVEDGKIDDFAELKEELLKVSGQSKIETGVPTKSYSWTHTFSNDRIEYSAIRLDRDTVIFSSKYFPKSLARVIIINEVGRGLVIFVHYDGRISMKLHDCLFPNEWDLVRGIKQIDVDGRHTTFFSAVGDKALKKYLRKHPISEADFGIEQQYIITEKRNQVSRQF